MNLWYKCELEDGDRVRDNKGISGGDPEKFVWVKFRSMQIDAAKRFRSSLGHFSWASGRLMHAKRFAQRLYHPAG